MMRIALFLITNLAVMVLLAIIVKLFGVETYLAVPPAGSLSTKESPRVRFSELESDASATHC